MPAPPWFRFYSETLTDRKIDRVCRATEQPKALIIGAWATLLALANDSPIRGALLLTEDIPFTIEDLAGEMGLDPEMTVIIVELFHKFAMVDYDETGTMYVANWSDRQFEADSSTKRVRRYREKRKALGMSSGTSYDRDEVLALFDHHCVYCNSTENPCVDHALPINLGGTDDPLNLVCACKKCNSGKAGRTPEQAGYAFVNRDAEQRYRDYMRNVTVTETTGNSDGNLPEQSRDRAETESEQNRAEAEQTTAEGTVSVADAVQALKDFGMGEPEKVMAETKLTPLQVIETVQYAVQKKLGCGWVRTQLRENNHHRPRAPDDGPTVVICQRCHMHPCLCDELGVIEH